MHPSVRPISSILRQMGIVHLMKHHHIVACGCLVTIHHVFHAVAPVENAFVYRNHDLARKRLKKIGLSLRRSRAFAVVT